MNIHGKKQYGPLPDDEVARRKALGAALWAQKTLPPLYRTATMDPKRILHGSFGSSSPVQTLFVFADQDGLRRPRLEIHTVEQGTIDAGAPHLWLSNFGTTIPQSSTPVTISGTPRNGSLLARTARGWMVSVDAPDATLLVIGPGEIPNPIALERVDLQALKRSEFHNSGIDEI